LPDGCIISIKAGTTRRQAQTDSSKPFRLWFPKPAFGAPLKVDVLSPFGTAALDVDPAVESYSVDVNAAAGGEPVKLQLQVRESSAEGGGESKVPKAPNEEEEGRLRLQNAASARKYLEEHHILNWTQDLLQDLIRDRPEEPWDYVQAHMTRANPNKQAAGTANEQTAKGPFLAGGGASPAAKPSRNVIAEEEEDTAARPPAHVTLGLVGEAFMDHAHAPDKPKPDKADAPLDKRTMKAALESALLGDEAIDSDDRDLRGSAREALEESMGIKARLLGEPALTEALLSDPALEEGNSSLKEMAREALTKALPVEAEAGASTVAQRELCIPPPAEADAPLDKKALQAALEIALLADESLDSEDRGLRGSAQEALQESMGIKARQLAAPALAEALLSDPALEQGNASLKAIAREGLLKALTSETRTGSLRELGCPSPPKVLSPRPANARLSSQEDSDPGLEQLRLRIKDTLSFAMKDHTLELALQELQEEELSRPGTRANPKALYHKKPSVGTWAMALPVRTQRAAAQAPSNAGEAQRLYPGDVLASPAATTDRFRVTDAFRKTGASTGSQWMPHPLAHPQVGMTGGMGTPMNLTWRMRMTPPQEDNKGPAKAALEAALSGAEAAGAAEAKSVARQGVQVALTEHTNELRDALHSALAPQPTAEAKEVAKQALQSGGAMEASFEGAAPKAPLALAEAAELSQALKEAVLDDGELHQADGELRGISRYALEAVFDTVKPATPGTCRLAAAAVEGVLSKDADIAKTLADTRDAASTALEVLPATAEEAAAWLASEEEQKVVGKEALKAALADVPTEQLRSVAYQAMEAFRKAPTPEEELKIAGREALEASLGTSEVTKPTEGLRSLAKEALEALFPGTSAGNQPTKRTSPYTFAAEPAVPRTTAGGDKAAEAKLDAISGSPSMAELEARIRQRNARFRRENEALRRDNMRLKQMQESGSTAVVLSLENAKLRKQLGTYLVGPAQDGAMRAPMRAPPAVA